MGEGAAAARSDRRTARRSRRSREAARGRRSHGRGVVDPDEPVFGAGDEGSCAAARRSRRLASTAGGRFGSTRISSGSPPPRQLVGLPAPDRRAARSSRRRARGRRRARRGLRLHWTGPRRSSPPSPGSRPSSRSGARAARGSPRCIARRRPRAPGPAAPRRQVDELRRQHGRRGRGAQPRRRRRALPRATATVLEAPISNVWWRSGDTLLTPSLDVGVLAGVTRATLLELAPRPPATSREEGVYPLAPARAADEAFTSSSIREVVPVVEIDGRPIGDGAPGEAARALPGAALRSPRDGRITLSRWRRRRSGSAGWRSRTACSCTGRRPGRARSARPDGELKVASAREALPRPRLPTARSLRGPARLAESFAFLPHVKRALPEAQLPFEGRRVHRLAARQPPVALQGVRGSRLGDAAQELAGGVALGRAGGADACAAARSRPTTAPSTSRSAATSTASRAARARALRHAPGRAAARDLGRRQRARVASRRRACRRPARAVGATVGAVAASTEIFGWMTRNPERPLARALARPGHELQHRVATAEPTPEQLEVAEAALRACLELEQDGADRA